MKPVVSGEVTGSAVTPVFPCTWSPWDWRVFVSSFFVCCSAGLEVDSLVRTDSYKKMLKA